MNIEKHKGQIITKFTEIDHKDGLILIESIINNKYDIGLMKKIVISLSENKKKYAYEIYDYIIKNTNLNYDTILNKYNDYSLIHLCAEYGNINLLNYLIKNGANINLQNYLGETALIWASLHSNNSSTIETVKLLLDHCADIDLRDNYGNTALILASLNSIDISSIETVKLLLENGASVNLKDKEGKTAYDIAPTNECKYLIKSYMK